MRRAAQLCEAVRSTLGSAEAKAKDDRSPVTVADWGAQAVAALVLGSLLPGTPILGEEETSALRQPSGEGLLQSVLAHVRRVFPGASASQVLDAIDSCHQGALSAARRFVLDPIDGTMGFLRGDQYAIALALLEDGQPVLGVLGCPALPRALAVPAERGCTFVAEHGGGAVQQALDGAGARNIAVAATAHSSAAVFCESVEARHSAHHQHARIAATLGVTAPAIRMDSQCKYGLVARGDSSIYLRLPTSADYREKVWDHAAGVCVVREAGGAVSDIHGRALDFSAGRTLDHNQGIVATNGRLHPAVLGAVAATLESAAPS